MAAVTEDQVTKTKLILYQSLSDVVQLTLTIFPLFIHQPGMLICRHVIRAKRYEVCGAPMTISLEMVPSIFFAS